MRVQQAVAPIDPSGRPGEGGRHDDGAIGHQTLVAMLWMYLCTGATIVLQVAVFAILARLITPAEFGLVAAALIVIEFGMVLGMVGLETSVVQLPTFSGAHLRTAYGLSLMGGLLATAAVYSAAPVLADAFGLDGLTPLLQVMAVVLVIRGLTLGEYLLARELRFKAIAGIDLVSYGLGFGVVAVVLALRGWGAWAIVAGHVGQAVVRTVAYLLVRPHPVRPALRRGPLRDLLGLGIGETLHMLLFYVAWRADNVIVGRWLGAHTLGLYDRAYRLMVLPTQAFTRAIRHVIFPAMAAVQDSTERLRRAYLTGISVLAVVMLPASVTLAVLAEDIVLVFLGRDWLALLPAFRILVFGMLFMAVPAVSDSLVLATGAVYRQALRMGVYASLVVVGALVGQRWGLAGVAGGVTVAMAVNYAVMARISLAITDLRWRDFAVAHVPGFITATVVGGVVLLTSVALRAAQLGPVLNGLGGALAAGIAGLYLVRMAPALPGLGGLAALVHQLLTWLPETMQTRGQQLVGRRYQSSSTLPAIP